MTDDFEPTPGRAERGQGPWMSKYSPEEYLEVYGQYFRPTVGYAGGYDDQAMKEQEPEIWEALHWKDPK